MNQAGLIDAHQHFWNLQSGSYPWLTSEYAAIIRDFAPLDLAPTLVANHVSGTVVIQARADIAETEWLLSLAADNDFILGVVGWVDLTRFDVARQIETLRRMRGGDRLVGIRHGAADEEDPSWLSRPDVLAGLRAVSDADLTFDLEVVPANLASASALATARPGLRLVLDHLGKPAISRGNDPDWERGVRLLASHENVWAKVSGLVTEADWSRWTVADVAPFVRIASEAFGSRRLIFGSDWPVCLVAASYEQVLAAARELTAHLGPVQRSLIFFGNAVAAYRLNQPVGRRGRDLLVRSSS